MTRAGSESNSAPGTGRRVLVIGAARSGLAATELLLGRGDRVVLVDRRLDALEPSQVAAIVARGGEVRLGPEASGLVRGMDLVVLSPGVPIDHPLAKAAVAAGIELTGELELAASVAKAPIVAVTGTDGKSTTVTLIGALLAAAGKRAPVVGNVGRALSTAVEAAASDALLVVEVSSFQLETARTFRPQVGVLLNIAPDHLDRHGDLATYRALKLKLFARQEATDDAILPAGFGPVPGRARRLEFGLDPARVTLGATVVDGWIVRRGAAGEERILETRALGIPGPHNLANALAAVAALERYWIPAPVVAAALAAFHGLPHRLELVAERQGVRFVNDSKATNVHALTEALRSFPGGIHLIAGGRDKAGDFASLALLVGERVARVYRIGEAAPRLAAAWSPVPGEDCASLAEAV
ncbi:MAG TPA: UDP-N-acetylmuramoyl-L-alanine--D-glutamate ligase, partial [Candidatus Udaeobacter sp.]|nr:UDP-N-acetylmuramoyl-L-alanine--D-glutamate ligase [Candidatus Udaeobacter sp.]